MKELNWHLIILNVWSYINIYVKNTNKLNQYLYQY